MPVPLTVDSIREQIREAIKLNLQAVGTPINTTAGWNSISTEADYPLIKAVYATSNLLAEYMGSKDMRDDIMYVEVAPWCIDADYELITSKIMETYRPYFQTPAVQASMDPTYAPKLGKISVTEIALIGTDLNNPFAVVRFTLRVSYMIQG